MNKKFLSLSKREKFVLSVFFLSLGMFIVEFFGIKGILFSVFLSLMTDLILYLILKEDIKKTFFYPVFILPFLYTLSFSLFYLLFPSRFISRILLTGIYSFGLYSLFLTQNIFAISSIRTINLLRSARKRLICIENSTLVKKNNMIMVITKETILALLKRLIVLMEEIANIF